MSKKAKREYLQEIIIRYKNSTKEEKKLILDEFCMNCGYNRKYAIRILNKPPGMSSSKRKPGRKKVYYTPGIIKFLKDLWSMMNLMCSKRLKEAILLCLPFYQKSKDKLTEEEVKLLMKISPATIDRILSSRKGQKSKRGLCTTKPGSMLRNMIPVKTGQWDESRPGYFEADTVAHCGGSLEGSYVNTLNLVDIATGWTVQRAIWGKGENGVFAALKSIESILPFRIRGFDSDNGKEFLNYRLYKYFHRREKPVEFTRSRAYKKNDNAHIEEKNWTVVRQYLGYERLDKPELVNMINDLYTKELYYFINFYKPSLKLKGKIRIGSQVKKLYDKAKPPYTRLMETNELSDGQKSELMQLKARLNPYNLRYAIDKKIKIIFKLAAK